MEEKICKSNAKNDYYLTDKDLSKYVVTHVTRYRKPDYVLYLKADVIEAFCTKYKVSADMMDDKLQELANKKTSRNIERENKQKDMKRKRKQLLINALQQKGLELRKDSTLCKQYIKGDKDVLKEWTLEKVVDRMCKMKYLYDYCHMNDMFDEAYKEQKEEKEQGFYPDCSVSELAEMKALEKYSNNKFPQQWPWL